MSLNLSILIIWIISVFVVGQSTPLNDAVLNNSKITDTSSGAVKNETVKMSALLADNDDEPFAPGFGNITDFSSITTDSWDTDSSHLTGTLLAEVANETNSVPLIDWRTQEPTSNQSKKLTNAENKRKNLKILADYLGRKSLDELVVDIQSAEKFRKVAIVLNDSLTTLLQSVLDLILKSAPEKDVYGNLKTFIDKTKSSFVKLQDN